MKKFALIFIVPACLLLSGCLGDVMEVFCETGPDSDHCYQAAAVQEAEPETCEKVSGKDFKFSNPPKDKCYLQIAQNTGDPSVCEKIEGGMMSYSSEECLDAVFKNHTVADCADAEDEAACRTGWAKHDKGCGEGFWFDASKKACVKGEAPGSDDGIDSKVKEDLTTIKDAATGKYMELLEKAIDTEDDPGKLAGLQAYKEFLGKAGETIENASATWEKMEQLKKIFIDAYDPSMDIDRMPVDKILEKGLFERMKDKLLGEKTQNAAQKEYSSAEDALSVYEAMLKRQGDIDYLKKDKLSRLKDAVGNTLQESGTDKVKEGAKEIAEGIAGHAFLAVGIVDHALSSFQKGAEHEAFVGLARAYNRRRDAIEQQNPGLSSDEIHKRVVSQVQADPYQDNTNGGFVKFGNLVENKDCQDESNPLCIDNRVFWTAMDKAYVYGKKQR